jgi:hypothetical protein
VRGVTRLKANGHTMLDTGSREGVTRLKANGHTMLDTGSREGGDLDIHLFPSWPQIQRSGFDSRRYQIS